jgi:hypothetical protein
MPIKKSRVSRKSRKLKKNKLTRKYRNSKKNKSRSSSRTRSKNDAKSKRYNNHKGGASCDLVTVNEPGFNVDPLGSMGGLTIASSSAAIYRPNCAKQYSSQAMAP